MNNPLDDLNGKQKDTIDALSAVGYELEHTGGGCYSMVKCFTDGTAPVGYIYAGDENGFINEVDKPVCVEFCDINGDWLADITIVHVRQLRLITELNADDLRHGVLYFKEGDYWRWITVNEKIAYVDGGNYTSLQQAKSNRPRRVDHE